MAKTSQLQDMLKRYQSGMGTQTEEKLPEIKIKGLSSDEPVIPAEDEWYGVSGKIDMGVVAPNVNARNVLPEAVESGYGQSRFDERFGYQPDRDLEDLRANEQSWLGKVTNGIVKGGVTTLTTAANATVGLVDGILEAGIFGYKDLFDKGGLHPGQAIEKGVNNKVSTFLTGLQQKMEEIAPNYYTEEERSDEYMRNFMNPTHWVRGNAIGDKFLKNFGFTLGAMGGGMAWNKLIGSMYSSRLSSDLLKGAVSASAAGDEKAADLLKKTATAIQRSKNVGSVDTEILMKNIKDAGKTIRNAQLTTQLFGATTAAMGEGTVEGLMARDEFLESYLAQANNDFVEEYNRIEASVNTIGYDEAERLKRELSDSYKKTVEYAERQGDVLARTTFLLNLPVLTLSNTIEFGKMFGGGWTTARRNAPKIKGSWGNWTDNVGSVALRGTLGSLKVAASEGAEEMAQGFISAGAKNLAETRLTYFKDMGYDADAMNEATKGIGLLWQGGKDYLGDAKNWEEGLIGAITGLLGISSTRFKKGEFFKNWNGGVIGEVEQAKAMKKASSEAAKKLNDLVHSEDFQERWRNYIRHNAFSMEMADAVAHDDEYAWHNAADKQLVSDVISFAETGRIEDLKSFADRMANIDLNNEIDMADIRSLIAGDNVDKNKELDRETLQPTLNRIKEQANDVKGAIDAYHQVYQDLANAAPADVDSAKFNEMLFTGMQLNRFENRFSRLLDDVMRRLDPILKIKAMQSEDGKIEDRSTKLDENLNQLRGEYRNAIAGNVNITIGDYISSAKLNGMLNSAISILEEDKKGKDSEASAKNDEDIKKIQDMKKVSAARRQLIRKLANLRMMSNEDYLKESLDENKVLEADEAKEIRNDTVSATTPQQVRAAAEARTEGPERDKFNAALEKSQDNPAVKEYLKIENLRGAYSEAEKNLGLRGTPQLKSMANGILSYMMANSDSVEDILNMNPNLIPTIEQIRELLKGKATMSLAGSEADKAMYLSAINRVKQVMDEIKRSNGIADLARSAEGQELDDVFGKQPGAEVNPDTRKKPVTPEKARQNAEQRQKEEAAKNVKEAEPKTTDEPNHGSDSQVDVKVSESQKVIFSENETIPHDNPDIQTPSVVSAQAVRSDDDRAIDATLSTEVSNEGADKDNVPLDTDGNSVTYYNTAFPEINLDDLKDSLTLIEFGDYKNLNEMTIHDFNEDVKEVTDADGTVTRQATGKENSYSTMYKALQDRNAFENLDKVKVGDKIFFVIDPTFEKYSGRSQVLMCTRDNDGTLKVVGLLREKDERKGFKEMRDAIRSEYQRFKLDPDNQGKVFIFSKQSKVWAKRPGIIQFGESVSGDTRIDRKPGYDPNATIIAINRDGHPITVRGHERALPGNFVERLTHGEENAVSKIIGNLYYLANGEESVSRTYEKDGKTFTIQGESVIPIRLNVEHYNNGNATNTGYGFDRINELLGRLVEISHNFHDQKVSSEDAASQRSEIMQELNKVLDVHGIAISFGYMNDVPTMRFYWYNDKFSEDGSYTRGDLNYMDIVANEVELGDLQAAFGSLDRSFNISVDNTKESNSHIVQMAENGMLSSNAKWMRSRGMDMYIDPFNPKTGEFESQIPVERVESESAVATPANTVAPVASSADNTQNVSVEKTEGVETSNFTKFTEHQTFDKLPPELKDKALNSLGHQGLDAEDFDDMSVAEQNKTVFGCPQ